MNQMALFPNLTTLLAALYLLCIQSSLGFGGVTTTTEKGLEYIHYDGVISGTFSPIPDCYWNIAPSEYSDLIAPLKNSGLNIGVAGPWDTNPFWFKLYHESISNADIYDGGILNLVLESADLFCYHRGGYPCGSYESNWGGPDWYFLGEQLLDLKRAVVQKTLINGVEGYQVIGSKKSVVGVDSTNHIDFEWTTHQNCSTNPGFTTSQEFTLLMNNYTEQFNYALAFTNNTASINTTLTTKWGSAVFNFTGTRSNDIETVVLHTTDPTKPVFTFLNGTTFEWHKISGHGYGVTAVSMAALLPHWGNEKWMSWGILASIVLAILN